MFYYHHRPKALNKPKARVKEYLSSMLWKTNWKSVRKDERSYSKEREKGNSTGNSKGNVKRVISLVSLVVQALFWRNSYGGFNSLTRQKYRFQKMSYLHQIKSIHQFSSSGYQRVSYNWLVCWSPKSTVGVRFTSLLYYKSSYSKYNKFN